MSLNNSTINVNQILALKELMDLVSDSEKKSKILSEVADVIKDARAQESSAQQVVADSLAKIESAKAWEAKATEQMALATQMTDEAAQKLDAANAAEVKSKEMSDAAKALQAKVEEYEKSTLARLNVMKAKALEAEKRLANDRMVLEEEKRDYQAKAAKLKQALGE